MRETKFDWTYRCLERFALILQTDRQLAVQAAMARPSAAGVSAISPPARNRGGSSRSGRASTAGEMRCDGGFIK